MAGPIEPGIWYAALAAEHGVIIQTDDPALCKQKLYALRKALADPDLQDISIMTSPQNKNELWLVKTSSRVERWERIKEEVLKDFEEKE